MERTLSAEQLAAETRVPLARVQWLTDLGILKQSAAGRFDAGDCFRVRTVEALLQAGFTDSQVEQAVEAGILNLEYLDRYYLQPAPQSGHSFAELMDALGPRGAILPSVYETLGFAAPDPSTPVRTDEEQLLSEFLSGWSALHNDDALLRAARLIGEGVRLATMGWIDLFNEHMTREATERFHRGDPELAEHAMAAMEAGTLLARLAPRMMVWLAQSYLERSLTGRMVEQFEEFMAARGLLAPPPPGPPPAVAFVDLSRYTDLTQQRGDAAAVWFASSLQECAERAARHRAGRLVKLLGDGAMLSFRDPESGVRAALDLVRAVEETMGTTGHAGVHAGPVIEHDRDLFGTTVNVAARITGTAAPGEVLVSEAVVQSAVTDELRFEPVGQARLKGLAEPLQLFRATAKPDSP